MSMPFYVSPEQLMKDRADFARKGIGRGRSVAVVQYADGIVFVAENPSQALHKISEIYDRIAFAAVGRYNEFENLRLAGVRLADMRGYAYDRRDVTGRGLANAYAQTLGTIFSSGGEKPYEVEIFVAEVGESPADDQVYRLTYDGQVNDEHGFAVMGGSTEQVTGYLTERYRDGGGLEDTVRLAVEALGQHEADARVIPAADLEVAVLDRSRSRQRKFQRLSASALEAILGQREPAAASAPASASASAPAAGGSAGDAGDSSSDAGPANGGTGGPETGPDGGPDTGGTPGPDDRPPIAPPPIAPPPDQPPNPPGDEPVDPSDPTS